MAGAVPLLHSYLQCRAVRQLQSIITRLAFPRELYNCLYERFIVALILASFLDNYLRFIKFVVGMSNNALLI